MYYSFKEIYNKKYVTTKNNQNIRLKFAEEALIDYGHRVAVVKTNMRKIGKDKYRKDAGTNIRLEEVRNWGRSCGCTSGQTEHGLLATQN